MAQGRLRDLASAHSPLHPINLMWPNWASMVLGPFAETKGPRRAGTKLIPFKIFQSFQLPFNFTKEACLTEFASLGMISRLVCLEET